MPIVPVRCNGLGSTLQLARRVEMYVKDVNHSELYDV